MLQAASSPAAWFARRLVNDRFFRALNDKQWRSVRIRFATQSTSAEVSASTKVAEGCEEVVKVRNVVPQQLEEVEKTDKSPGKNIEEVKKFVSRAPRYSKAARRYYNEKFRTEKQRLSKVLAAAGIASRRACEEVIFAGKVTVNGKVCKVPETHVDPLRDIIYIAGKSLPRRLPPKLVFALYKPKGYICSDAVDDQKKSVSLLLEPFLKTWTEQNPGIARPRLFNIGRLDVGTTGLLLLTNDGNFAHKVAHPSSGITKEYVVTVGDKVTKRQIQKIAEGTTVDGVKCVPVAVELLTPQAGGSHQRLRVVVSEGRNHEVRQLVENAHLKVHALKRIRVGGLRLPANLSIGKFIQLTDTQLKKVLEEDPVLLARSKLAAAIESQEQEQVKMVSKTEPSSSSLPQVKQHQTEQLQSESPSLQQLQWESPSLPQHLENTQRTAAVMVKDSTTKPKKKKKDRILSIPTRAQGPVFIPRRGRENQRTRFLERA